MDISDPSIHAALLKLTDTVSKLTDVVEKLSKKEHDPDDAPFTGLGEEEGWETVRDMKQHEQRETVDSWKDELNNLLVFAGLFSAVVTAFTVESYGWLQQDSGAVSNALLARLSFQLSAFTIGSTFLNSSFPPLALSEVESSFSPVSYAVHVNTLWVLSLTLSLVSAFSAIAVQQWLRQLHLPPDMPVRKAVQLMAVRSDALQAWQVPSIISLLPLLLQVAVVLFLVGLFLLLQASNTTVALVFGVVAFTGVIALVVTAVIPLITVHCPYKSPIIPTGAVLLQCISYPLVIMVTPVVLCFSLALQQLPGFVTLQHTADRAADNLIWHYRFYGISAMASRDLDIASRFVLAVGAFCEYDLIPYIKSFGRHMFIDLDQFWLSREYQYLDSHDGVDLEQSSLVSVLLAVPGQAFPKVLQCLGSFRNWRKQDIFRDTVLRSLRAVELDIQWDGTIDSWGRIKSQTKPFVRRWLSHRHRRLLWSLLRHRQWTQLRQVSWRDSDLLTLFHELDGRDFVTPKKYIKHLLRICRNQEVSTRCYHWETTPARLVLGAIQGSQYVLDQHDANVVLDFTSAIFGQNGSTDEESCQLHLVAGALALSVLGTDSSLRHVHATNPIRALDAFLSKDEATTTLQLMVQARYNNPSSIPHDVSVVPTIEALGSALAGYAATQLVLGSTARSLARICAVLRDVCCVRETKDHDTSEDDHAILSVHGHLDDVHSCIFDLCLSPGWELLAEGWDGYLVALAVAEDAAYICREAEFELAMEALVLVERQHFGSGLL